MRFTTTDPTSGLSGTQGETVLYVSGGAASLYYKYGPATTAWCPAPSLGGAESVTADPRSVGLARDIGTRVLYVTGGAGTLLYKYGPASTAWCTWSPAVTGHSHAQGDVTGLVSALAGKAASSHVHAASDITSGLAAVATSGSAADLGSGTLPLGRLSGITDSQIASANKDGTTATASLRTLGTGAQQAAAGDHTHGNVQTFNGSASWQTWTKPTNARCVVITAIGAGGGGGGGFGASAGNARGGGGGGGGAACTRLVVPAALLPDTLYVLAPLGGSGVSSGTAGTGALAYVSTTQGSSVASNIIVVSGGTTAGGATSGTGAAAGALGSGGSVAAATNMPRGAGLGQWLSIAGVSGTNGGAQTGANGSALTIPNTGACTTGGTGGGGTTSGNFAGGIVTSIANSTISDGRPTGSGSSGTLLGPSSAPFFSFGGLGGAANNSSAGGQGGTGAYGSGGGGGGGGTTGGAGGNGGDAYVQIVSW